jgi:hypothetical protein
MKMKTVFASTFGSSDKLGIGPGAAAAERDELDTRRIRHAVRLPGYVDPELRSFVRGEIVESVDRLQELANQNLVNLQSLYERGAIDGDWFPEAA